MTFKEKTKTLVSKQVFKKLEKYCNLIEEKNKVMNLTGFSDDKLWQEGIYESIFVLSMGISQKENLKILDIGAGAGFPSIPFLIAFPNNELHIYEPMKKRIEFLELVKKQLKLNVYLHNIRAEDSQEENIYDVVTARAVTKFKILSEISHKVAKINGLFYFIKGPKAEAEIKDAKKIISILSIEPEVFNLKIGEKENKVIKYNKKAFTPDGFPRSWSKISK